MCESFTDALSLPLNLSKSLPVAFGTPGTTSSALCSLLRSAQADLDLPSDTLDARRVTFLSVYANGRGNNFRKNLSTSSYVQFMSKVSVCLLPITAHPANSMSFNIARVGTALSFNVLNFF